MNRLTTWIKTVIIGHKVPLTDAQLAGDACTLCGAHFSNPDYRVSFGWIGLPFRRRAWACETSCTVTTVDDTEALFRAAIPARQNVNFWHLGSDDVPLVNDYYGFDSKVDEAYVTGIAALPEATVEIVHPGGVLTTRPLPEEYARQIAVQAQKLGFTAMIDESAAV